KLKNWIDSDIQLHIMESSGEAIKAADIIITTTTSFTPVLPEDAALLKNKLTIGIGSFQPGMREFPKVLYNLADHILVDSDDAFEESGDMKIPLDNGWIQESDVQT